MPSELSDYEPIQRPQVASTYSQSSSASSTVSHQFHNFVLTTYTQATYCDLCTNFIWGIMKQGYTCQDCGYNAHKKCYSLVSTPCHLHDKHSHPVSEQKLATPRSISPLKKDNSLVAELLAETHNQSRKLEKAVNDFNPDLHMTLFMKQNNRYSARQGPLIWVDQTVVNLVTWRSTSQTCMFLVCYILICLHPILLAILPQCIILGLMIKFYYIRADQIMNNKELPPPHVIGTPPKLNPSTAELKVAFQNIQNTMGKISDAYDAGYNFYRMIDWTNPELTKDVMIKTIASMFISLLTVLLIPINYIFLFGGVGVFIANTAIVKAASVTLAPVIVQSFQKRINRVRALIDEARTSGVDAVIDVAVFENQRWWAGAGWVPVLLQNERAPWSDITGTIAYDSKDTFAIPSIAELTDQNPSDCPRGNIDWKEPDWQLSTNWSEVDEEGWEYSNQNWQNPRPSRILGSFTRRRKWVRHLVFSVAK